MEMDQNSKAMKDGWSKGRYVRFIFGMFLLMLGITLLSDASPLGEFLTYASAFFFGIYYPLFGASFIALGLCLCFLKHWRWSHKHTVTLIGLVILLLSVFSFSSLFIVAEQEDLVFSDALHAYEERFIGFAGHPYHVDDFSMLPSLGAGYLGLLSVAVFNESWGVLGNIVFYSILLIIGAFLCLFYPISDIVQEVKRKMDEKVSYTSPNQRRTKNEPKPIVRSQEVFSNEEKPVVSAVCAHVPSSNYTQGGFSTSNFLEKKDRPLVSMDSYDSKNVYQKEKEPEVNPQPSLSMDRVDPLVEKDRFDDQKNVPQASFTSLSYAKAEEKGPSSVSDFSALTGNDTEEMKTEKKEEVIPPTTAIVDPSYRKAPLKDFNPLLEQAKNVRESKSRPAVENEVRIDYQEETGEESTPNDDSITPMEEDEESVEALFFEMKEKKRQEKIEQKELEKEKRLASLMKYVNDKPRVYSYSLPTDSLLEDKDSGDMMQQNSDAALEKAKVINQVFEDFHFPAKAVSFTIGASVTRFNIQTEPGVKADKMETLLSELQRALKGDQSVRIQTVVEGRSTSGIELGNAKQMPVTFKSVFEEIEKDTKENLLLPIGKDISGNIITYPLNEMPHLLVAGTTGSGKSVLVNCMIMTLIMRNYPSQLKLMLIDPKQVEFAKYNMEPHLLCPVIQDTEKAIVALKKLVDEMERRYSILRENNVVKIAQYRMLRLERGDDSLEELPDIAVFIDEFADLMNTGGQMIADYVQRLSQKARAAGIYLVIATQRPSKDAIPMMIKSNITCRVGLSCSSQVDSRVILDENGCETLVGKGDLLFKCPGKRSLLRCQSAFISDEEMDRVLEYVRKNAGDPSYNKDFLDLQVQAESEDEQTQMTLDEIFDDVKDYVMVTGICSRSSIMRNFSLSYAKADQMLLRLKNLGIIKAVQGGKNVVVMRKKMED